MKKLEGKVAIITGAGAGIGKAIVREFLNEGSAVVASDINSRRLNELEKEIGKKYPIKTITSDISIEKEVDKMTDLAISQFGRLDILVNNAGIMDHFQPVAEVDNDTWSRIMKVNVDGPFFAMRRAIPHFLKQGSGVIVNIASIGGIAGARAGAAYTASKFALVGLTKNTGYMYSKLGIRCNAIAPGGVHTLIGETIDMGKITPLINDRIMSAIGTNPRMADPVEIARVALFLASEDASFVNGAVWVADGGWTAH